MVHWCAAYGCSFKRTKGSGISFHRFPMDPEIKKQWVIATKRKDFKPSATTVLCGKHFEENCYIFQFGRRILKKNSVRSIFGFPEHLQTKTITAQRTPTYQNLSNSSEPDSKSILSNTIIQTDESVSNATNLLAPKTSISELMNNQVKQIEGNVNVIPESKTTFSASTVGTSVSSHIRKRSQPVYFGDCSITGDETPIMLRKIWSIACNTVKKQKRTINKLTKKV